jgi:hypothetical protein
MRGLERFWRAQVHPGITRSDLDNERGDTSKETAFMNERKSNERWMMDATMRHRCDSVLDCSRRGVKYIDPCALLAADNMARRGISGC